MTVACVRAPSPLVCLALAILTLLFGPPATAAQVGDAFLVFDIVTGRLSMNPGSDAIDSYSIGATGAMEFNGNAVFPSYAEMLLSENISTRIGAALYALTGPDIDPDSGQLGGPWGSISGDNLQLGSTSGSVIPSTIPGWIGTPEWSFGFVGPTNLTLESALAGLGATEQGGLASSGRVYSAVGVTGEQKFRVYAIVSTVPEPRVLLVAAGAAAGLGALAVKRRRRRG